MTVERRWEFEKVGLGYHCWSDEIQTHLRLTKIKRSRDELTGDLAITTNIKGTKSQANGVFHRARFNVSSSPTRSSLAKTLGMRTPGQDMDWADALEALCQGVMQGEEEGEPVEEVGHDPARPDADKYLVEPLVLKGQSSIIFGPGGSGKSLIALACGLSVAAGREIIPGVAPAVHGNVLYLDWETEKAEINDRVQAIAAGYSFKPSGMFYRQCRRSLADMTEDLSAIVAEKKIVLVIVDSAAFAMGGQNEHNDVNDSTIRMYTALRQLGTSNHIVDHVNRTDSRTRPGKSAPYGSIYKDNSARNNWELRKADPNGTMKVALYYHKGNSTRDPEPFGLEIDWRDGAVRFNRTNAEVAAEEPELDTASVIRELLSDGEAMGIPAMLATIATDANRETMRRTIYRMADRGELTKTEQGQYVLGTVVPFRR